MNVGKNIKMYRKKHGFTQEELGKLSELSKNAIYNYENNKRVPTVDVLKRIAKALDVQLTDLISDDSNNIYIDICGEPLEVTYRKLEVLSADKTFMEDMLNEILHKEKHELNLFEQTLLIAYSDQEHFVNLYCEILKFLANDVLQKQLGYSFKDLASNEIDLIRMSLNIINSIKNDLKDIENSKKIVDDSAKDEVIKKQ